jgi:hypothetical protein
MAETLTQSDRAEKALARQLDWIARVDSKLTGLVAIKSAILAAMLAAIPSLKRSQQQDFCPL